MNQPLKKAYFLSFCLIFLVFFGLKAEPGRAALIRDSELEAGLLQLAGPLAREAGLSALSIRLILDPSYNAFVIDPRHIYLHSGVIVQAETVEELQGVLAHEIGHLAAGHIPRRSEAVREANLATMLSALTAAAAAASGAGEAALGLMLGGSDQAKRSYLARSRNDEAVADEMALRLLDSQQISAGGLTRLMRRMAAERALPEASKTSYYRSHPGAAARLRHFEDHLAGSPWAAQPSPAGNRALFQRLKAKLQAWTEPPDLVLQRLAGEAGQLALYQQAIAHFRRGTLAEARQLADQLQQLAPQDPWFAELAADIAFAAGDLPRAARQCKQALALSGEAVLVALGCGRILIASGDRASLQQAAMILSRAADKDPRLAFLRRQQAIAFGRLGRLAEADLMLAEEALLLGDRQQAARFAQRVLDRPDLAAEWASRAADIQFLAEQGGQQK